MSVLKKKKKKGSFEVDTVDAHIKDKTLTLAKALQNVFETFALKYKWYFQSFKKNTMLNKQVENT